MKKDKRKITVWKNGQQVKLSLHQSLSKEKAAAEKEKAATLMDATSFMTKGKGRGGVVPKIEALL